MTAKKIEKPAKHLKMNIQALLDQKGWSISKLAEDTGLNYKTIHSIVRNKYSRIGLDTLEKICKALNVDAGDLFVWE
jgi:DNA-binding Xre family transcriptional regulator